MTARRRAPFRLASLGMKLAAVTSLVLLLTSSLLFMGLTSRERANLIAAKTSAAAMVEQLLVVELAPALDFGDADDVREQLAHLRADPDIAGAAVWYGPSATPIADWSTTSAPLKHPEDDGMVVTPDWLVATQTIVSRQGTKLARLQITFTLAPENASFRANRLRLFWMTASLTAAAAFLLLLLARLYVVGPIGRLVEAAGALAEGDHSMRVDVRSDDEIGDLTRAFNAMGDAVSSRQEQITARNRDMKRVLDHVAQGLFTVDRDGLISSEYSRTLVDWLGLPAPDETLWSYVAKVDASVGDWLSLAWETVTEGVLPLDVALAQMPTLLRKGDQYLRIEYTPIVVDGRLSQLLVVLSDMTSKIAREKADAAQRELVAAFEFFARDRNGFAEFFAEGDQLVSAIAAETKLSSESRRRLHTLKGTCAMFGFARIAGVCHRMEETIADTEEAPSEVERKDLSHAWREATTGLSTLLGEARNARIQIEPAEHEAVLRGLLGGVSRARLAEDVARWRFEPVHRRLDLIAEQARKIAGRLGKGVRIVVESNDVRLHPQAWAPLWSALVHVIRNSLDHGIALEEDRAGEDRAAQITIRTHVSGDEFVVEVEDNGRGIDWEAVASRGRALGVPSATPEQLEALLFREGVSTKNVATELSGRGVGLDAARAACASLGGRIQVRSARGAGTVVQFRFPARAVSDGVVSAASMVWRSASELVDPATPPRAPASSN